MTHRPRFRTVAEPRSQRDRWAWWAGIVVVAILLVSLVGCAGSINDYAALANAYGEENLDNLIQRRAEQNDLQLKAAVAEYCGGVSVGAVQRRYQDMAAMMARLRVCEAELRIGL